MFDRVIRGGPAITPSGPMRADVGIEGEFISAVAPELAADNVEPDARGQTVMPGLIDAHVHFNKTRRTEWEGATTGSRAFAAGGGTLFFDMLLNTSPSTLSSALFKGPLLKCN